MRHIIGYFEVLNMQFVAENTELHETYLSSFIRPVRFIASDHPDLKFELFSDSMVLGCIPESLEEFIGIIQRLFRNWSMDYLIVRGGVVSGQADAISGSFEKILVKELSGIQMWRFSGPAVVNAYQVTQSIAYGMICLLSPELVERTDIIDPTVVTHASPYRLFWPDPDHLESYVEIYQKMLKKSEIHLQRMTPHIEATVKFIEEMRER